MQPLAPDDPRQIGAYRLLGRLGAGGMGRVYLGRTAGGRTVAVKVVRSELADDREFRDRFRQEVQAARRVGGAWTAQVLDADPEGPRPWVATAYVAGPSLSEAVEEFGPLPEDSVRALVAGLAEALAAVHGTGLVHRDVKPSNVLLAADGPRLIDFGIARAMEATSSLTRSGAVVGSPGHMSPEQVTGGAVGPQTDVFSLGTVLVFAARGRGPFEGDSAAVLLYKLAHEAPDLAGLDGRLRELAESCLRKDPARRPEPAELARSLAPEGGAAEMFRSGWLPAALVASLSRKSAELLDLDAYSTGSPMSPSAVPGQQPPGFPVPGSVAPGSSWPGQSSPHTGGFGPPPSTGPQDAVPSAPPGPYGPAGHTGPTGPQGDPAQHGHPGVPHQTTGPQDAPPPHLANTASRAVPGPAPGQPTVGRAGTRRRRGAMLLIAGVTAAAAALAAAVVLPPLLDDDRGTPRKARGSSTASSRSSAGGTDGTGATDGSSGERSGAAGKEAGKPRAGNRAEVPKAFIGRWSGSTTTENGVPGTFSVTIRAGRVGAVVARDQSKIPLFDVDCSGDYTLRSAGEDRIVLDNSGGKNPAPGVCSNGSPRETFTLLKNGTLRYESGDAAAGNPSGELVKGG